MAIPLSNDQREVRAPQTANLKAVNVQPAANQMAQSQLAFQEQFTRLGDSAVKARQRWELSDDAFKRNEAERKYNRDTSYWSEWLSEKEGEERQKAMPKYEAEMKLASDAYEAAINKVRNFEIREGSKRSINAWNTRNASNYQYENYKNETNLQEKAMGEALVSSTRNLYNAITPADNAQSVLNLLNDPNLGFAHGEEKIREFYGIRKGMPAEVVDEYVKDYKSKALTMAANRLAELTDQVGTNAAYDESLKLINQGIQGGIIQPEEGVELKRDLEDQKLDMIAETNPGALINGDGTYNFAAAHRFAPDLTRKEIYKKLSSAKKNSGNGTNQVQEEIAQMGIDLWNDSTTKLGYGDKYATKDFRENADNKERFANARHDRRTEGLDLIRLWMLGRALKNGTVEIDENGVYTDPTTGYTVQTSATGTKRILQKQTDAQFDKSFNDVRARLTRLIESGEFKDVFNPAVIEKSNPLTDQERAVLAQFDLLHQKRQRMPENALERTLKNVFEATGIKHYKAEGGLGVIEMESSMEGTILGISAASQKYGFNPDSIRDDKDDQMQKMVHPKQFNSDKKIWEDIPGSPEMTMGDALTMEIGYYTLQRMDDETFKAIYGPAAQKPKDVLQMQQYGYQLDFNGRGTTAYSGQLNKLFGFGSMEAVGNAFLPMYGSVQVAAAKAFGIKEPAPFNFTDAQLYNAVSMAGSVLKKGLMNVGTGNMPQAQYEAASKFLGEKGMEALSKAGKQNAMAKEAGAVGAGLQSAGSSVYDYLDNIDPDTPAGKAVYTTTQILNKMFSGKPNNEPLTYNEFVAQEGTATPDSYTDYLSARGAYLRTLGDIQGSGANSQYLVTSNSQASDLLSDLYAKAAGMAPSNANYISEDIQLSDIIKAGTLGFTVPQRSFNEPSYTQNVSADIDTDKTPVFIYDKNTDTGYMFKSESVKQLDCNFDEFVTLLAIAQGIVPQQPNVSTQVRGVPAMMVSNDFKPR